MRFTSRMDAGRRLGKFLQDCQTKTDLVLGLPRGGVLVASEVAGALNAPLDALVVRKIGHPMHREFAIGALAEGNVAVLDESLIARALVNRKELMDVIEEETSRLQQYRARFQRGTGVERAGKHVLIIDDGLATGSTMEAAVRAARKQGAARVTVAVPVASTSAMQRLEAEADEVFALVVDSNFEAVGRYYDEFPQATDEEVMESLYPNIRLAS